jgi:hypothetical protein
MSGEADVKKLIECPLEYSLSDEGGLISNGGAVGRIDEENVSIVPRTGEPIFFSPREVLEFVESDYTINLLLTSKEKLVLSKLGINFENFSRLLSKARNEVVMKDLLMQESLIEGGFKGSYEYNGKSGSCELRLYDSGLVAMAERGEPLRFHYSNITGVSEGDYSLTLALEGGEKLVLSKMGGQHEPFRKALNDAMNRLALKTQDLIKSVAPQADSSMARRAARIMRDGKAARKGDLDAISPVIWHGLEKKIEEIGVLGEYEFLRSLAQPDKMCIGLKRGLMGDFTGDYLWILAPVPGSNAIILEAVSAGEGETVEPLAPAPEGEAPAEASPEEEKEEASTGGGRWATYVFRVVSRAEYPPQDMTAKTDDFIKSLNDCMLAINFRREPIFTMDEDLELPKNVKYWYSVQRLPSLRELRSRFVGRVIHANREQWQRGVKDVLSFNVGTKDDKAKYKK